MRFHRNALLIGLLLSSCATTPERTTDRRAGVHALLAGIKVDESRPSEIDRSYQRKEWEHWIDEDGDCQDTRDEVLIRDGSHVTLRRGGCDVAGGTWNDPYTGKRFTRKSDIDIDHLVPLKDAHVSGGAAWNAAKKRKFANYLDRPYHLLAVEDNANQSKRAKSPDKWMPPNAAFRCTYLEYWVHVKSEWELSMTREEFVFVGDELVACASAALERSESQGNSN